MQKPVLLILSFSELYKDARILKQIRMFRDEYDVITCGFGEQPESGVRHVELQRQATKARTILFGLFLRTKLYRLAYWIDPVVQQTLKKLSGIHVDAVLANDLDTVGLARKIASPEQIHVDLHEYWPGLHDNIAKWRRVRAPLFEWQLENWAKPVASVTTVNQLIADRYQQEFGFTSDVVPNATEYQEINPTEVHQSIRLVHSGGAQPSRKIEMMMRAVARADAPISLDLLLVGKGTEYFESLIQLAQEIGPKVNIIDPVPYAELVKTLNSYDAGITFLPPTSSNNAMALPNKFFDYIQARVGVIAGPTPSMAELIQQYGVGIATSDFEEDSLVAVLEQLDPQQITTWKQQAHLAAKPLSAQQQSGAWKSAIARVIQNRAKA